MSTASVAPLRPAPHAVTRDAVVARQVDFSYATRPALREVSFTIAEGEIFAFLGPNGGGKTTLFRLLSTLVAMQTGEVLMLGCDLASQAAQIRLRLGVVFQHPSLDDKLTVRENLIHHGHLYGLSGASLAARATELLTRMGLAERARDLVETLSGGLQRRTELAKALLHRPSLLLLDEPSTGLDPTARREFNDYLCELRDREGVTIVLTTHYMEEAERADRVAILDDGRLVALASPLELKNSVGGDVVVVRAAEPQSLLPRLNHSLGVQAQLVDGAIRLERRDGHRLVSNIIDSFGAEVQSIAFGKPTLEDVFVHLTGRRFRAGEVG
ncbi:MAG TPA: ATP-binding cassette domain-containing protein [Candidatus Binataceae bacterium]|nr:ATP-binding cassette domain-containing protein [Candidatus Binataceae bacterium]